MNEVYIISDINANDIKSINIMSKRKRGEFLKFYDTEKKASAGDMLKLCERVSKYAKSVMVLRQKEVPMYKLIKGVSDSIIKSIIEDAYAIPAMSAHTNRIDQQNKFYNTIFKKCYNSTK
jgi:hypothetical protein